MCSVNGGCFLQLVERHGPPDYYHHCRHAPPPSPTNNLKAPQTAFQSLCRIVAGQQLAGSAAQAIYKRLLKTVNGDLQPATIMALSGDGLVEQLQKPAGLSKAKARSIVALAEHFSSGHLSEDFLTTASEDSVREALRDVKGIGPWSCDMFLMFALEKPNILPVGDLGVRKGMSRYFQMEGSAHKARCVPRRSGTHPKDGSSLCSVPVALVILHVEGGRCCRFLNSPKKKK